MRRILALCLFMACTATATLGYAADTSTAARPVAAPDTPAGDYTLDKHHADLTFRVNHLGFSFYMARFATFDARLQFDPGRPAMSHVEATVDVTSLELDNPPAGFKDMLLGKEWFDAVRFPKITFVSTKIELTGANAARINGNFTLHGVTRPLILDAVYNGGYAGHPMDPHARIGFSARGSLSRSEFGMAYGVPAPGTTMGVGDKVEFVIEAEFSGPALSGAKASSSSR